MKLWIAFACLCSVAVSYTARQLIRHELSVSMQIMELALLSLGVWFLWHLVFHLSLGQEIWGILSLVIGFLGLIGLALWLLGSGISPERRPLVLCLMTLVWTTAGWVLAIDKDVARYRAALENEKRQRNANG